MTEFFWKYSGDNNYAIRNCTYLFDTPKYIPLELVKYNKDFTNCFQLGSWSRTDEGYEFSSCGSRMFDENISDKDLLIVWKALSLADKYLNERFEVEND
jgi:hypothetical protein